MTMSIKNSFPVIAFALLLLGAGCTRVPSDSAELEGDDSSLLFSGASLDLSNRGLTQVSQDVFKKTNLVSLDLSGNQLTGSLPGEIRFLTRLEVLDASENSMTGVPAEIGQLTHLKQLILSNNQLTGLPLELGNLSALELLDLRGNAYSVKDLEQIRARLSDKVVVMVD